MNKPIQLVNGRERVVSIHLLYDLDALFNQLFYKENMTIDNKREVKYLQKQICEILKG